jgi:dipeptidyl aminopeptidase/acylaminoacyl peptidase
MEYTTVLYSKGIPLKAKIRIPSDNFGQSYPLVILCHGHSRHMDDGLDVLATRLESAGIASIRFNFRGCGIGSYRRYHLYCSSDWIEDLTSVIDYAQRVPSVDSNRLGLAGISMGGSTVVSVSGIDPRVKCTVAMAPIDDCSSWLQGVWQRNGGDWEGFEKRLTQDSLLASWAGDSQCIETIEMYNDSEVNRVAHRQECLGDSEMNQFVTLDSLTDLLGYKPIDYCKDIEIPMFLINGDQDVLVPADCSRKILSTIKSKVKKHGIYEGVDHNIPINPQREVVFKDIVVWFTTYLA